MRGQMSRQLSRLSPGTLTFGRGCAQRKPPLAGSERAMTKQFGPPRSHHCLSRNQRVRMLSERFLPRRPRNRLAVVEARPVHTPQPRFRQHPAGHGTDRCAQGAACGVVALARPATVSGAGCLEQAGLLSASASDLVSGSGLFRHKRPSRRARCRHNSKLAPPITRRET